jgi:hypothetical protein
LYILIVLAGDLRKLAVKRLDEERSFKKALPP